MAECIHIVVMAMSMGIRWVCVPSTPTGFYEPDGEAKISSFATFEGQPLACRKGA